MPVTIHTPIGSSSDPMDFTPSAGALHETIDDDPLSPNLSDYAETVTDATDVRTIIVDLSGTITAPETGLIFRLHGGVTGGDVSITDAYLIDDDSEIAASMTVSDVPLVGASGVYLIAMTYVPDTYNWATARLSLIFTTISGTGVTTRINALDLQEGSDTGPGGQVSRNASFFMAMRGPQ